MFLGHLRYHSYLGHMFQPFLSARHRRQPDPRWRPMKSFDTRGTDPENPREQLDDGTKHAFIEHNKCRLIRQNFTTWETEVPYDWFDAPNGSVARTFHNLCSFVLFVRRLAACYLQFEQFLFVL